MSHFIDTMAFAGELPWHGLGTKLAQDVPSDIMQKASGLDWEPVLAPLFLADGRKVENGRAVLKGDLGPELAVVGTEYTPFHNRQLFELGDALAASGEARWHTAGSLKGGQRVWALLQSQGSLAVRNGDELVPFLLVYNSHDGRSRLRVRFTTVRVVCHNTATMALGEEQAECSLIHRSGIADTGAVAEKVAEVLGIASARWNEQQRVAELLASQRMSESAARGFICQMLSDIDEEEAAVKAVARSDGRTRSLLESRGGILMDLFREGLGNRGESAWDALNAVTEYVDHARARSTAWKAKSAKLGLGLDSAWFGDGERKKQRAVRLLVKRAGG